VAKKTPQVGARLWPAKLGIVLLRVFVGAVFLATFYHKVLSHDMSFGDALAFYTEGEESQYREMIVGAIETPPRFFGTEMTFYSDFLQNVMLEYPRFYMACILIFEGLLGLALVMGFATRIFAFLGALLMCAFALAWRHHILTVSGPQWLLAVALFTLALTAAGRIWGVDARLRHKFWPWIS